jgi:hypothetical protein
MQAEALQSVFYFNLHVVLMISILYHLTAPELCKQSDKCRCRLASCRVNKLGRTWRTPYPIYLKQVKAEKLSHVAQ